MGLFRIGQVLHHIAAYQIDEPLKHYTWRNPFNWLRVLCPWLNFPNSLKSAHYADRLHLTLERLGPLFVKFGQVLSTRRDLLPDDVANALAKLQDKVTPFPGEEARALIEAHLGQPITTLFKTFDEEPLAAASIAQVHVATLHSGEKVAVKVLRPKIAQQVRRDLRTLRQIARLFEFVWPASRQLRPSDLVKELHHTLTQELDLRYEAANASQLARHFEGSDHLHVPTIYWDYVCREVLVTEYIDGIPISDMAALKAHNLDLKKLAERGVVIFFRQAFEHCFFHADMHPGNVFVDPSRPDNPRYMAVDFGIMGTLTQTDQQYLAENFLAFFQRDYRRVALLHIRSGWVPADTRLEDFEGAIRTLCEPIFGKPLKDISFAKTLMQLLQVARAFRMEVQPQLLLLQKTLFNIEGLGRDLYPDLDLWETAHPFLEKWMRERRHPKHLLKHLKQEAPYWLMKMRTPIPEAPQAPVTRRPLGSGLLTLLATAASVYFLLLPAALLDYRSISGLLCAVLAILFWERSKT